MHVQIVTFQLNGVTDAEYRQSAVQEAPAYASVPGLISKVWLADADANTYGGVLTWESREAMERFKASESFQGMQADPIFGGITSREFDVLGEPTRITRGLAAALA